MPIPVAAGARSWGWDVSEARLYLLRAGVLEAIDVTRSLDAGFAPPAPLFDWAFQDGAAVAGGGWIAVRPTDPRPPNDRLVMVLDWFDQLRELAPPR